MGGGDRGGGGMKGQFVGIQNWGREGGGIWVLRIGEGGEGGILGIENWGREGGGWDPPYSELGE